MADNSTLVQRSTLGIPAFRNAQHLGQEQILEVVYRIRAFQPDIVIRFDRMLGENMDIIRFALAICFDLTNDKKLSNS